MSSPVVEVRGRKIGEGIPKICVPIMGQTPEEIYASAKQAAAAEPDLVEWRVDYYLKGKSGNLPEDEVLEQIRSIIGELPLLFTFRSEKEGGEAALSPEDYSQLSLWAACTDEVDLVDIEYFTDGLDVKELAKLVHGCDCGVVMSNHDFEKTPSREELVQRLCGMQEAGADIAKIAVMPRSSEDVLALLAATEEMKTHHTDTPVITMSMGAQGTVSRLCGELFGSAVTFGAAGRASAPGQVGVSELKRILKLLHGGV